MIHTYLIERIPARQRRAYLAAGVSDGATVTIDTATEAAAALFEMGTANTANTPEPAKWALDRIPDDYDPEQERRRLRQGGCCGSPSRDVD